MNIDQLQSSDKDGRFDLLFDAAERYADSTTLDRLRRLDYPSVNEPSTSPYPYYRELEEPIPLRETEIRDHYSGGPSGLRLEPYREPGALSKARNILRENGPIASAISPLFGLQYKDYEDAPRNIAGGITELTGHPMVGEAVDVAAQFIPGVAAIAAYDNGRIPGILDFVGGMNPLKWSRAEKVLTGIGGAGDLISRWLNSIPKRDNK